VAEAVITGRLGKDPDLARNVAERVVLRTKDVRQSLTYYGWQDDMMREAAALAWREGLEGVIEFREASAEALPFPDSSFDVSMSFTVDAADADRMLGEMVRVTRPGGRIGMLIQGHDLPCVVNLPLRTELKAKAEAPRGGASNPRGCANASLYRRFHQVGLTHVKMFPQLATAADRSRLQFMQQNQILPVLNRRKRGSGGLR